MVVAGNGHQAMAILAATWGMAFASYALARWLSGAFEIGERLLAASYVIPSIGMAFVLPLTIHAPVYLLLGGTRAGFDDWAELAMKITWATHIAFAILAAQRAHVLALGEDAPGPAMIFVGCVAVSCVPYVVLFGIPPIIVALTGLPIVGLMRWSERHIARERAHVLHFPTAIARRVCDAA